MITNVKNRFIKIYLTFKNPSKSFEDSDKSFIEHLRKYFEKQLHFAECGE